MKNNDLCLIVMENCKDFGLKVDDYLKKIRKTEKSFILPIDAVRFSDGEGKVKLYLKKSDSTPLRIEFASDELDAVFHIQKAEY